MKVYYVIKGINMEGEDVESLELFFNKKAAEKARDRMMEEMLVYQYVVMGEKKVGED